MIRGTGVDIQELARFEKHINDDDGFAQKVLTESELHKYETLVEKAKINFLAGRFSVKEAFAKALGTGIGAQLSFHDIETLNDKAGKPVTTSRVYHGKIFTSISHSSTDVVSQILLED